MTIQSFRCEALQSFLRRQMSQRASTVSLTMWMVRWRHAATKPSPAQNSTGLCVLTVWIQHRRRILCHFECLYPIALNNNK